MSKKVEWYKDFVNESYKPNKNDIVVLFYSEPEKGISKEETMVGISENNL